MHYRIATIVILSISLLGLQEAKSYPDMPMTLTVDDKIWMHQQLENLKSIEPFNHDALTSDNNDAFLNNSPHLTPQAGSLESSSQLLIFISFSMPKESLKALARQAKKAGGTLVLRGLVDNSVKKTLMKIVEVFGKGEFDNFTIDPIAFKDFGIKMVPAIVVAESLKKFDVVYGDISLFYALKSIVDEGDVAVLANSYLRSLKE